MLQSFVNCKARFPPSQRRGNKCVQNAHGMQLSGLEYIGTMFQFPNVSLILNNSVDKVLSEASSRRYKNSQES